MEFGKRNMLSEKTTTFVGHRKQFALKYFPKYIETSPVEVQPIWKTRGQTNIIWAAANIQY